MTELVEVDGGWALPCEGLRVSQIRIDYAFGLEFTEDQERATDEPWWFRISTPFTFSTVETGEVRIDPEGPAPETAPALSVRHKALVRGRVWRSGDLTLDFEGGARIHVPVDDRYEAWEATGGDDDHRTILVSPIGPDTLA